MESVAERTTLPASNDQSPDANEFDTCSPLAVRIGGSRPSLRMLLSSRLLASFGHITRLVDRVAQLASQINLRAFSRLSEQCPDSNNSANTSAKNSGFLDNPPMFPNRLLHLPAFSFHSSTPTSDLTMSLMFVGQITAFSVSTGLLGKGPTSSFPRHRRIDKFCRSLLDLSRFFSVESPSASKTATQGISSCRQTTNGFTISLLPKHTTMCPPTSLNAPPKPNRCMYVSMKA